MALRVPMLLLLSGTFAGGVASTQIAPKVLPLAQPEASTEVAAAVSSAGAETKSSAQPVKEASAATQCNKAAWPYVDPACTGSGDSAAAQPERQVRVISTNRDAPSRVPIPARAEAEKVQVAAISEAPAAPEQSATSSQAMASAENGADATPLAIMPPEKPDFTSAAQEKAAKAESAKKAVANERVETTASIRPAAQPAAAKERVPARRQVARAEHRRDLAERIRQVRQNFDEQDDTVVQTATYRYADGRQIAFRSEPYRSERRRWAAQEPIEQAPPVEFRPVRPANDTILGWLFNQ